MLRIDRMSRREVRFVKFGIPALLSGSLLVMASCRDPLSTEQVEIPPPLFAAQQGWVRSSFNTDQTLFVPCLGETFRFFGTVPFQFHSVRTPSGTFNTKFQLLPGAVSPPFLAQGLTSGRLYRYENGGPFNETFHSAAGEVFRFKVLETYMSESGDRLEGSGFVHVTVNANGEVTAQRSGPFEFTCRNRS